MVRYLFPFPLLASIPILFYTVSPMATLTTVGLLLAALIGAEFASARGRVHSTISERLRHRLLLHVYIPLQLGVTIWGIDVAKDLPGMGLASLILSEGVVAGVFGMLAAHEMIHSRSSAERMLGTVMLSGLMYRHFRIAHVHGHHRWAATEIDSATARLGESFYAFLPRTVSGQMREAFCFEQKRTAGQQHAIFFNRVVQDVALMAFILGVIALVFGWLGAIFFIAQSVVAIIVLEMFNYIAHYGLKRRRLSETRWERLDDRHSWNSSNVVANLVIFNMGRHSFHHRKPVTSYESLQFLQTAPELPFGYAASILLALIPPLWRQVMDPRVRRLSVDIHQDVLPPLLSA